jgi:hypothetical protein
MAAHRVPTGVASVPASGPDTRTRERGFAIAFSLLMIMILTLLGASLLLVAATENRIAENERLSAQALYAAESGVRVVKRWFDRPESPANVANPTPTVVDRSLRLIDVDGDPGTPPVAADGTPASPYYKQGVDLDASGADDLFAKPFRGSLVDTLMGTEAGPDIRIDESASTAARTFLGDLSDGLFADFPGRTLEARITRIDIYAPPYVPVGGSWERFGMATVKVIARIYQTRNVGSEIGIAERMIKVVLNEIPYNPGVLGPLHSCKNLSWNGEFTVFWGTATAVDAADLHNNHDKLAVSWPRALVGGEIALWGHDNGGDFAAYETAVDGLRIDDPWLNVMFGGQLLEAAPIADPQPWPFGWTVGGSLEDGDLPYHPGPPGPHPYPTTWDGTHSNCIQNTPVDCPEMPYELWKNFATSGGSDVHYYVWDSGTSFREDGVGPAMEFRDITDQQTGLFFFDTKDGLPPHDDDADGVYDNLTPAIKISGGTWGVRGMVYLNSLQFQTTGVSGRNVTFNAPGELFRDENFNGRWDAGENWINLGYPTTLTGLFTVDASDRHQQDWSMGPSPVRNRRGPDIVDEALVWGILYTNGYYDATGNGVYYGTVISKLGIGEFTASAGTPHHYWDESIGDGWPPDTWGLPRVGITRWETDM